MLFNWLVIAIIVMIGIAVVLGLAGYLGWPKSDVARGVRVPRVIAIIYAVSSGIAALYGATSSILDGSVSLNLPVEQFWPTLPDGVHLTGATARVTGGGFSQAAVQVAGLAGAPRAWLAAGYLLQGAMGVVIGVVAAILCTSVIKQNPFRPVLIRGINLSASAVIVGGLGWQICSTVAGDLASAQVLGIDGWELDTTKVHWDDVRQIVGLPGTGFQLTLDFWPLWVALALFAVSAVFRYGQRLQKDTEGLV